MARYVMINRRAGKFKREEKLASRNTLNDSFRSLESHVNVINDFQPENELARRVIVFDADANEIAARQRDLTEDVILEPEILHYNSTSIPMDLVSPQDHSSASSDHLGTGSSLVVEVSGNGKPVEGAEVIAFFRAPGGIRDRSSKITGADGIVSFDFNKNFVPIGIVTLPHGNFWMSVDRGGSYHFKIDLQPLPATGPREWWHEILGHNPNNSNLGQGIKVGVIDTGVGPHPFLEHINNIGAFIDGAHDPLGGADVDRHGSHVSGIIGAKPVIVGAYAGIASGADLFSARVFPPGSGANQGDIVNAIDALSSNNQVDLINMSLGSPTPSNIEQDAIQDALERGTLCICAAANSAADVEFPAAFPETVAVSAIGLLGWGPPWANGSHKVPNEQDKMGDDGLFLADFSCFGPEVTCAGPGVSIISTVPARFGMDAPYAAMDGTSMSSPAVCAALASILSNNQDYLALPRADVRAEMARSILRKKSNDIGLKFIYQGHGLPTA